MDILVTVLLFVAFCLARTNNLKRAVQYITLQSALLSVFCLIMAVYNFAGEHVYLASVLTFLVKVLIIPFGLFRLVNEIKEQERTDSKRQKYSSVLCVVFLILSYGLVDSIMPKLVVRHFIAASLFLIFTGLIIIVMRHQAIMQILGLITVENGIYMLGVSITSGLPLVIELGIFLDVLIAVVILVILTKRMRLSLKTSDTSVLRRLRG